MKKIFSLLVILSAVIVLSACSKKDEHKVQGVTDNQVLVGNCAVTTGDYAMVGTPFNAGIQAYFKMINDQGGVDGRKIKFINESDDFDSAKGQACTRKMIEDKKVFALVGHFGTPTVSTTLNMIKDAGIPAVYLATGIGDLYNTHATGKDRVVLPVQPIYQEEGKFMVARAVKDLNKTKIAVLYTNDDAGDSMLEGIQAQVADMSGVSIVKTQSFAYTDTDVSSQVTKIKGTDADIIIVAAIQGGFVTATKELAKQNVDLPIITSYVNASATYMGLIKDDIYNTDNNSYKFDVYTNAWVDLSDTDAVNQFTTAMEAYMGDNSLDGNAFAMAGWIAGKFFVEGLQRLDGKEITWDSYIDAMEQAPIDNPFGGQIDFRNGKRVGTEELSLLKLDYSNPLMLPQLKPIQTLDQILAE